MKSMAYTLMIFGLALAGAGIYGIEQEWSRDALFFLGFMSGGLFVGGLFLNEIARHSKRPTSTP